MGHLDGVARLEEVQALTDAGQPADRCEIGRIERHTPENGIQGVVSADDHLDGRRQGRLLRCDRRGFGFQRGSPRWGARRIHQRRRAAGGRRRGVAGGVPQDQHGADRRSERRDSRR